MYKRMNFWLVVVLAVLLIFGITPKNSSQELPQVFSAADQFSLTQNPNGTWSYGFTVGLGGPFTLYTINGNAGPSGASQPGWFGPFFGGFPLVDTNSSAQSLNYFNLHPAVPNLYSVVRWTAPTSGEFDLLGLFLGTDFATTDVHVLKNGVPVFDGQIRSRLDTSIFDRHLKVVTGDTIDFAVGVGTDGSMDFDSTGFKATITGPLDE